MAGLLILQVPLRRTRCTFQILPSDGRGPIEYVVILPRKPQVTAGVVTHVGIRRFEPCYPKTHTKKKAKPSHTRRKKNDTLTLRRRHRPTHQSASISYFVSSENYADSTDGLTWTQSSSRGLLVPGYRTTVRASATHSYIDNQRSPLHTVQLQLSLIHI